MYVARVFKPYSHAQAHGSLRPSYQEVNTITRLQQAWGGQWKKIAAQLPGRTPNTVKNRWYSAVRYAQRQALKNNQMAYRHAKQDNQMGAHIVTAPASAVGGAAPEAAKQKTRRQRRLPSVELPNNLRKNCEDCQVKPASYGPPGEGKVRWCASCAESHPGTRCLSNPCEDCQRKTADYVSQGEGKRR